MGHLEPLNPNERFKKDDDGLNVRARIENVYSQRGFASIDPADLRGRFRWWGLYTQRRPGIPGGRTAVLEPHELDDEFFMLRIRIDGGQLTTEQLRVIADVSTSYARDTADVTDRQNVQLHWIRVEDVPEIWQRLEAVGLSTTEACGDTPRVVLGSPVAGIAAAEVLDASWAVEEIQRRYIGSPEFSNLPRKFKTAVSGLPDVVHETNDVAFVGVVHPEHGPGLDLWVGGGLSTNPKLAQRLGAWVPIDEVPDVWAGVVGIFRDYGYRRLRTKARLKFLVDDWGAERFREILETNTWADDSSTGRLPRSRPSRTTTSACTGRRTAGSTSGWRPGRPGVRHCSAQARRHRRSTRLDSAAYHALPEAGDPRRRGGSGRRAGLGSGRSGTLGSAQPVPPLHNGVHRPGVLQARDRRDQGPRSRDCGRAGDAPGRRRRPARHPDHVNVNGCPNSCARIQVADIGLKGQIVKDQDGFQVHLGGGVGLDAGFGRKLRGLKVTAAELPDYVERVVRRFVAGREAGERFAQWIGRAAEEDLQ